MKETIPYPGAKPMYLASDVDDKELLKDIVLDTYKCLRKLYQFYDATKKIKKKRIELNRFSLPNEV